MNSLPLLAGGVCFISGEDAVRRRSVTTSTPAEAGAVRGEVLRDKVLMDKVLMDAPTTTTDGTSSFTEGKTSHLDRAGLTHPVSVPATGNRLVNNKHLLQCALHYMNMCRCSSELPALSHFSGLYAMSQWLMELWYCGWHDNCYRWRGYRMDRVASLL